MFDLGALDVFDRPLKIEKPDPATPEQFNAIMDEKLEDGKPKICFTKEEDRATIYGAYAKLYACMQR